MSFRRQLKNAGCLVPCAVLLQQARPQSDFTYLFPLTFPLLESSFLLSDSPQSSPGHVSLVHLSVAPCSLLKYHPTLEKS